MVYLNAVTLIGRCANQPGLVEKEGFRYAFFTLIMDKPTKNNDAGESSTKRMPVEVKCFGSVADLLINYVKPGDRVGLQGELDASEWYDENGYRRMRFTVVAHRLMFLDFDEK
jgi:single stranded DNA-binding protein